MKLMLKHSSSLLPGGPVLPYYLPETHRLGVLISYTPRAAFLEAWSSQVCGDSESSSYKTLLVQAEATASPGGIRPPRGQHHFAALFLCHAPQMFPSSEHLSSKWPSAPGDQRLTSTHWA